MREGKQESDGRNKRAKQKKEEEDVSVSLKMCD